MPAVVWKGYISFGLVSFPVRLFSAGRAEAIHFHMLHRKDLSRVKEVWYCAKEDKPIERSGIVKGYEINKDELRRHRRRRPEEGRTCYSDNHGYFAVCAGLRRGCHLFRALLLRRAGRHVSKPYELFWKALKETKYSALAKVSMHGREHVVLIRAAEKSLVMHTLFYEDELHQANQQRVSAKANSTRKELDLATKLIHQLAGPFRPQEFHDTYRENVERLIEQTRKGKKITTEAKPKRAPVIDLMEALKKSLKSSEAPAKAARTSVAAQEGNKTKKRSKAA
jgi:DNA end-binding protein Ku